MSMRNDLLGTGIEYRAEMLRYAMIEARDQLNLSISDLAEATGVPAGTISTYESHGFPLSITDNLQALADALGVDLEEYGYKKRLRNDHPRSSKKVVVYQYPHHAFGRAMQAVRMAAGYTQATLGKAMEAGDSTIAAWEIGLKIPRPMTLRRWCEVLGEDYEMWAKQAAAEKKKNR